MGEINSNNYVDQAEKVILNLINDAEVKAKKDRRGDYEILTTTQLRKLLSMTAELFSQAENEADDTLSQGLRDSIEYLRIQFVYQAGREKKVKEFVDKAEILPFLKSIKGKREEFLIFCRYMEALVAFRKYHGKKDE